MDRANEANEASEAYDASDVATAPLTDDVACCPECGADRIVSDGGCPLCRSCGWSHCSYSPI